MIEKDEAKSNVAKLIDAAIILCLFIFVLFAPHSIAVTQGAWLLGMALWLLRFPFRPRPTLYKTPVDYLLLGFFILTVLSSLFSYEPAVSIGKLRAASLFTIIYLFAENVPSLRVVRLLVILLICSSMLSVAYTGGERLIGRGVKVYGVSERSPLYEAGVRDGDSLLEVAGETVREPQDLVKALSGSKNQPVAIRAYRHELQPTFIVAGGSVHAGVTAVEQLGIGSWSRGRDWRATGFYGQFVTYAEVLQLIIALTMGLLVSLPIKRSWIGGLLVAGLVALGFALLLTVTRASWLGCLVSTLIILLLSVRRRVLILIGVLAIPLILAGLFVLQQKRNVAFIDQADQSTTWRETVWREGFRLLVSKPRHLLVGIGMDSIKRRWREWGMFDGGRIPWGHMHSNVLQIALERGVPALIFWLGFLFVYARALWRAQQSGVTLPWIESSVVLGALGGLAGFFTSGLVHYNWGDSEVIMVFYLIMGLALFINRKLADELGSTRAKSLTRGTLPEPSR